MLQVTATGVHPNLEVGFGMRDRAVVADACLNAVAVQVQRTTIWFALF
jgi:hypothetical protein